MAGLDETLRTLQTYCDALPDETQRLDTRKKLAWIARILQLQLPPASPAIRVRQRTQGARPFARIAPLLKVPTARQRQTAHALETVMDTAHPPGSVMREWIEAWRQKIGYHLPTGTPFEDHPEDTKPVYTIVGFAKGRNNGATVRLAYQSNSYKMPTSHYNYAIMPGGRISSSGFSKHVYSLGDVFQFRDEL